MLFFVWFACGVFGFGFTFAYFQALFIEDAFAERFSDLGIAILVGLMGPVGLFIVLIMGGYRYGLRYLPIDAETSWKAFQKRYPTLDYDEWLR